MYVKCISVVCINIFSACYFLFVVFVTFVDFYLSLFAFYFSFVCEAFSFAFISRRILWIQLLTSQCMRYEDDYFCPPIPRCSGQLMICLIKLVHDRVSQSVNSMKLVIPLHSLYWSIHTKDESKRGTAFAFIFGVN